MRLLTQKFWTQYMGHPVPGRSLVTFPGLGLQQHITAKLIQNLVKKLK